MNNPILIGLMISSMVLSTGTSVFATENKDEVVSVTGNVQKYMPEEEISVELPVSMIFDIGFDKETQEAQLQSADYSMTNKGEKPLDVTAKYNVTDANGITLTSPQKVNSSAEDLQVALSLNKGDGTAWIQNIENGATGNAITLNGGTTENMKFSTTEQGLANITQHDKAGKIKEDISTIGNLVFTFNLQEEKTETKIFPATSQGTGLNEFYFIKGNWKVNSTTKDGWSSVGKESEVSFKFVGDKFTLVRVIDHVYE